jgi:hypothetical protein
MYGFRDFGDGPTTIIRATALVVDMDVRTSVAKTDAKTSVVTRDMMNAMMAADTTMVMDSAVKAESGKLPA